MRRLDARQEGTISIIAALLVLFSAMWSATLSISIALLFLFTLSIYKLLEN